MAIKKRGDTYHTDFMVDGQRYRMTLDTSDWREAQTKQKELITQASQGKLAIVSQQFARLPFSEAADRYLLSRQPELIANSLQKERCLLVPLKKHFGGISLLKITVESLLHYREARIQAQISSATVNMEMGVMRRLLKRAKRWHVIADEIKPLKERRNIGRAMSVDEKEALINAAEMRPEWFNARAAMILALNTTMRGCEIKSLRWRDIDLLSRTLTVKRSKTEAGERVIPLNMDALGVVLALRERAKLLSNPEPHHYLFPACENDKIDPEHPMRSWRSAWRQLTRAIKCLSCGQFQRPSSICSNKSCKADISSVRSSLTGLRFHDLRHHAITELAESDEGSDSTIMAIAGHVSQRMLNHYSHIRLDAKRKALDSLSSRGKVTGYVTNHGTKQLNGEVPSPQVIEKYGRPEWTRTIDLFRVKEAL